MPTFWPKGQLVFNRTFGSFGSIYGQFRDIECTRATLAARIAVDHIGIEKAAGMEALLTGSALDEAAHLIRLQLADQLPPIQIPVKVQQSIELPAVTTGPVRLHGARLPITAGVSQVFAGQGRLWIAIHFQPGEFTKTTEAPQVADSRAQDVETGFDAPAGDASQTPKGDTKPKPNTAPKQKQPPKAEPRGSAQGGGR